MRLLPLLLPIFLCAFATIALGKSVLGENEELIENGILPIDNRHTDYFRGLSADEQAWLMKAAILYDEVPAVEQPDIPEIEEPSPIGIKSNEFVPYPVPDETPAELMAEILNGKIPEGWQKQFTSWLRTHYNLTSFNFQHYRRHGVFCPPSHSQCPGFGDIGAECCPWG